MNTATLTNNNLFDMMELVGGPLCGASIPIEANEENKEEYEVPYYAGIAIYRKRSDGKAQYIGEFK